YVALADYSNIYCLDTGSAAIRLIPRPQALHGAWVPTGIAYRKKAHQLYIANYLANNIIEGTLDCAKGEFSVGSVISTPDTVSPENVAITDDGNTLISANYDGNSVTAFRRGATDWKALWTAKVPLAHGLAIVGARVYATGLQYRRVSMIDLESGKILKQAGQLGADPERTDLMWPTGLTNFGGTLVLSDAHTGYVCSINSDTLLAETCFG